MTVVEKITVFRSSAVSSAPRAHHPLHQKSSLITPTTPQLPPRAAPTPRYSPAVPTGTANPPQALPPAPHQCVTNAPAGPCPNTPHNPLGGTESDPSPTGGPTRPSPPAPAPIQFPRSIANPKPCTASELYSCAIQQRRRPTPAYNVRHWPATCGNDHH
jgi:hypothetical protein